MQAINPEHLKQLRHIFDRFDTNSDGSITQLELAALLRSLEIKHTGDELYALLPNLDSNGNGFIEFDELAVALLPDLKKDDVLVNQDQLLEVFRCFDRDGNGFITAAELAGSMAKMGHPLSYKELGLMMREADVNGDGVISFNEFSSVMGRSAVELFGLNNANINTNTNTNNNDPS